MPADYSTRRPDATREPPRRPGAPRTVDPAELQALLDYRDERARLEQSKRRQDGSTPHSDAGQRLRGAAPKADPHDLQSLIDYRDERARLEAARIRRTGQPQRDATARTATGPPESTAADQGPKTVEDPAKRADPDSARAVPSRTGASRSQHTTATERLADRQNNTGLVNEGRPHQDVDRGDRDPEMVALINAAERAKPSERLSNRDRPPQHGDVDYQVDRPQDWSTTITDIDLVYESTLWEIKEADGRDSRMDVDRWIGKQLIRKLDSYAEAREHLPGYENSQIGYFLNTSDPVPEFKDKVVSAIDGWQEQHPDVIVRLRWRE